MPDLPEEDAASPEEPVKRISFGESQTELSDADLQLLLQKAADGELNPVDIRNLGKQQLESLMFATMRGGVALPPLVMNEVIRRLQITLTDADVFLSDSQARVNQLEMEEVMDPAEREKRLNIPDGTGN